MKDEKLDILLNSLVQATKVTLAAVAGQLPSMSKDMFRLADELDQKLAECIGGVAE